MIMSYILLILGIMCLAGALVLVVWPRWVAAVPAFAGLVALHLSYYIAVPASTFIFWGIATALVAGIVTMSPQGEPAGRRASNLYVGVSAMAGCLLGILVGARIMILGVILGAFIGQMAYSRTPAGTWLRADTGTFLRYFAAKCLPVIVAVSIVGIAVEGFIF